MGSTVRRSAGSLTTRRRRRRTRETASSGGPQAPVLRRFRGDFRWDGVELEPYKLSAHRGGEFVGASRQVLAGPTGEKIRFHVRYFELEPHGFTSLERHRHSHFVIGVRGRGRVRIGRSVYPIGRFDTVYIGPNQPHQLSTAGRGAFGFFCIVDSRRDKPRPVASHDILPARALLAPGIKIRAAVKTAALSRI